MNWTLPDLMALPLDVYGVLEEVVREEQEN
jgi:hypothetical protein